MVLHPETLGNHALQFLYAAIEIIHLIAPAAFEVVVMWHDRLIAEGISRNDYGLQLARIEQTLDGPVDGRDAEAP